jgi:hypothetical protein
MILKTMKRNAAAMSAVATVLTISLLAACAGEPEVARAPDYGTLAGPRFALNLEPGAHYAKDMRMFLFSYTVWPQVAVWLEKPDGAFVETLYVTELAVTGDYTAAPKEGRPEALPVWSHLPKESVDAVSSPTTVGSTVTYGNSLAARLPAGEYVVKLETNRSYDWNASYTKKNSGVNGQPSLVYEARLTVGGERTESKFTPVGTGAVDGADGNVRPGLDGIDTALQLFSSMTVSYEAD